MIFMAKVCPKAINFATAESIHQLLALRPHPNVDVTGQLHLAYVAFAAGTTHLKIQIGNTPDN